MNKINIKAATIKTDCKKSKNPIQVEDYKTLVIGKTKDDIQKDHHNYDDRIV